MARRRIFDFVTDFSQLEKLASVLRKTPKNAIDKRTADQVGRSTIKAMKTFILSGQSPIDNVGDFPAYKDPQKYPGRRKPATPVNLKLTGEFLKSLSHNTPKGKFGFETNIFYRGTRNQLLEQYHREGANEQPERPTIPENNETFRSEIIEVIEDLYEKRFTEKLQSEVNKLSKK